jgi:5-methylcytosine-specific restriction endonuclease McrA
MWTTVTKFMMKISGNHEEGFSAVLPELPDCFDKNKYDNKEQAALGCLTTLSFASRAAMEMPEDSYFFVENPESYTLVSVTITIGEKKRKVKHIKVDRHAVYAKYNNNCAYCGNHLEFKDMQVDHFVPKTKFQGEGADELENLMPSCKECNMDKGNMLIDEWRERLHNASETVKSSKILASALKFNMIEIKPFDGKFYYETS